MKAGQFPISDLEQRILDRGKAEGKAEGEAKGKAEGKAEDILAVLRARGIRVPAAAKRRILAEQDLATLDGWLLKAVTATRLADVLGEPA